MKKKNRQKSKSSIKKRVFIPVLIIIFFQSITFFTVLALGGEFNYVEQYAYDMLTEKTSNRKNYVEDEMQQQWSAIYESVASINHTVQTVLDEQNADIGDIKKDKDLNSAIVNGVFDDVLYMLRKNSVNDAFVIFETGNLYTPLEGEESKAGIYLRDVDPLASSGTSNDDVLMEVGYSSLAQENDITLDTEWSANLEVTSPDDEAFRFYYETINTATAYSQKNITDLGHWTTFSRISRSALESMKYTVPLIDGNGVVYGVVGIGITEKSILRQIPSNDLISESACYVLALDDNNDGNYKISMHSGSAYTRLIGSDNEVICGSPVNENIIEFNQSNGIETIGNIQKIKLYNTDAPYSNEQWALISVADNVKVLKIYYTFIKMLLISAIISIALGIFVAIYASKRVSKPFSDIVNDLNNTSANETIKFKTTGISEVDRLTNAIEELQVAVEESASRVSQIINLVGIGIGAFMYERAGNTVFLAESLVKILGFDDIPEGDAIMNVNEFSERLLRLDTQHTLFNDNSTQNLSKNGIKMLKITEMNGDIKWLRFNVIEDDKKIIGVVQDVTRQTIEKKKIEYERDYDITTGLLNRRAYYQEVAKKFQRKSKLKISAFVMLDLDNLKYVNDTYGHDFGDDYIKTAANALKKFKDYDALVSRLSGDEFNIFLSGFNSKDEIRKIINEVRNELINSYCILLDGSHFKIRASAGVSWYPENSESYEQLMKYADFAMYTIKNSVKGTIAEFDMNVYSKDSILITGTEEMNRIIDECSVKYAFHSIVDARTGEIYGYEALMRPQSEILKSPLEFIRLAKTGAKLNDVEKLTWTQALKAFKIQVGKGNISASSKIFVNSISNCILNDEDLEKLESDYQDLLNNVVLEILEGEETNNDYADKKQQLIKKWHGKIALDDFGTGYNSEYALITSHPDIIKIDRSIISGCDTDESRQSIMQNLIRFSKIRNVMVLAEGVETYQEMKMAIQCGVDLLQGYYINRPVYEPEPLPAKIVYEIKNLSEKSNAAEKVK